MWNELERSIREASKEAILSKLPKTESSKHIERLYGTSHGTSQQYFRGKEKDLYTKHGVQCNLRRRRSGFDVSRAD